ncbi:MAG: hypothetical protein IPP74_11320 [Alphaproteobacteria bacterium]|nr:hypothetical protein [Alphaproteobacteria bacterium]
MISHLKKFLIGCFVAVGCQWMMPHDAFAQPVPRVVIALYNGEGIDGVRFSPTHRFAEMPLNQVGLVVEHYDVRKGLPDIKGRKDVRGVLTWYSSGTRMKNPQAYLKWAEDVINSDKKLVILGDPGFYVDSQNHETPVYQINHLYSKLGIQDNDEWVNVIRNVVFIKKDLEMVDFERQLTKFLFPYQRISVVGKDTTSYLTVQQGDDTNTRSHLVVTNPHGGFVAENYAFYLHEEYDGAGRKPIEIGGDTSMTNKEIRMWNINPFAFFSKAFQTDDLPKPDASTLAGRRIYYSHIDGDGWNNVTYVEKYRHQDVLSSQVIMDNAIKAYPDLPITVAPIAAEMDLSWAGIPDGIRVAKQLFALPHVEVGSHTFTHPYEWQFFEHYNRELEKGYSPMGKRYNPNASPLYVKIANLISKTQARVQGYKGRWREGSLYEMPRAYLEKSFDLNREVAGSIQAIQKVAPKNKPVNILMWSGNTMPYEEAIKKVREAGIANINGGDSRYDREYPSYGWVSPLGLRRGNELQVYSSSSNENTYTDLWTGRYHGFKYLLSTIKNTDFPMRVKPFNIYYHMYTGEKEASLDALKQNLDYAMQQDITPVEASEYSRIVQGFYRVQLEELPGNAWIVRNRGELQTIRFDKASKKAIDFERSRGVIGERQFQGSLYVYLDANEPDPVITLKTLSSFMGPANEDRPYLVDSRWLINHLKIGDSGYAFSTRGYGRGEMKWYVPDEGNYQIEVHGTSTPFITHAKRQSDGTIRFVLPKQDSLQPIEVKVTNRDKG